MKLRLWFLIIAFLCLIGFWVSGCVPDSETQEYYSQTPPITISQPSPMIVTITQTLAVTIRPSATNTPTLTSTPTPLPPTRTNNPPVTLEPDQAINEMKALLATNQNCISPCFWGITPNKTTLEEASNTFQRLGFPLTPSFQDNNLYSASPYFDDISISVQLEIKDGIVNRILGKIGLENYKGPTNPRFWSAFSPDRVFQQYGKPTDVEFNIYYPTESGFPEGIAWYELILKFDQHPFAIDYFFGEVSQGKQIRICPLTDKFDAIDTYFGFDPSTYYSRGLFGKPIEKITSINVDQFYELMTQNTGVSCLNLDSEAYNNP